MSRQQHNIAVDSSLWLAIRLPDLPLNVLGFDAQTPQALVINEKQRAVCINKKAQDAGVAYNMDITTARLLSDCHLLMRDCELEQHRLQQLSEQLYQFTPYIEIYSCPAIAQAGLLLEISRCLQLFSGVRALCSKIFESFNNTGYPIEFGLAHSAKAAWLLSFANYEITGEENKDVFCERLKTLPIGLLHDYPAAIEGLHKTGFITLGDIARQIEAQSISAIKKRFGTEFADAICDIFAIEHHFQQASLFSKPVALYQPVEFFVETWQFDYPLNQLDQLQAPMETMLQKLKDYLRKRQYECQHIEWALFDIYRSCEIIHVHADNAQSAVKLLYELTFIQLEQRQLPFAVDTLELRCKEVQPIQNRSQSLDFNQTQRADRRTHHFATTAAKLKARLGDTAIFKLSYGDNHFPEASNIIIKPTATANQQLPELHSSALRPGWLFAAPIAIEERAQGLYWRGYLNLILGPERIQGNWWDTPSARDYFLAQRSDNLRLWVFLDLHKKDWFVHGIFG